MVGEIAKLPMAASRRVKLAAESSNRIAIVIRRLKHDREDLELWFAEKRATLDDVKTLIKTYEFDPDEWDISIEDSTKTPPKPRKPKAKKHPANRLYSN